MQMLGDEDTFVVVLIGKKYPGLCVSTVSDVVLFR